MNMEPVLAFVTLHHLYASHFRHPTGTINLNRICGSDVSSWSSLCLQGRKWPYSFFFQTLAMMIPLQLVEWIRGDEEVDSASMTKWQVILYAFFYTVCDTC